ncbi:MAG: copper amine oxidase N-terminal domain-containing protein [bacterium]|nr:copper amine oxidase N-terminal domain-containing protein [bacterium]
MNRKIIAILLAAGMVSASASAFAADSNNEVNASAAAVTGKAEIENVTPYVEGTVKSVSKTELELENNTYKLSDETLVYENTGKKVTLDEVKKDSKVFVVSGDSENADIVVIVKEDCINGININTFDKSDTFGTVVDKDNNLALNLDDKSVIVDTEEKAVKLDDIMGKKLLVFCGAVAMSIPGQTTPDKVVVLGDGEADKFEMTANFFKAEGEENSYVSEDNSLVINIGEETVVVDKDGKEYTGSLDKKNLTVSYTVTTRSIPPQTTPEKVVVNGDAVEGITFSDTFFKTEEENTYVSSDNSLEIRIGEETVVVDKDGKEYKGSLDNKDLTVTYTVSTRSIPAKTTPEKVVVNGEGTKKQEPIPTIAPEMTAAPEAEPEKVEAGSFKADIKKSVEGIILLPVRGVCEALGVKVDWNGDSREVILTGKTNSVKFEVEKQEFTDENGKSAKAQIIEDRTYAPTGLFAQLGLKLGRNGESITVSE